MRPPRYHYEGRDARSDDFDFFEPSLRRDLSPPRGRPLSPRRPLLSPRRGPFHAHNDVYRSRYSGGRFDGPADRRSRSPRDRSPYHDRPSQFNEPDRRRSDSRPNTDLFPGRDTFRGPPMTGRDPPRGPKALLDRPLEPPSGPRGGGGFRGRGGRGGGRGWVRDDSRDRGRDRDFDPRDRPPPFRDERSRERDRDWGDRDRDGPPRDGFRNRRPSPPPPRGRGRSPPIGRDFRDNREPPVGIDVDRARRGSRDGPLSAGSSNSDPPFGSGYRGGFGRGGDRGGRGRGRGDYDRGRGGRGGYLDDRDRFNQRSRSHDRGGGSAGAGWGRGRDDRDDRDRIDRYPMETDRFPPRDPRNNDRPDLIRDRPRDDAGPGRPASERFVSREPSIATTRDKSPPPMAPSAPAFGSIPNRKPSIADIPTSLTGKPPPTGPRALATEDKSAPVQAPVSVPQSASSAVKPPPPAPVPAERLPPTGPSSSKPILHPGSPPIPIGPRAHQIAAAQKGQSPMTVAAPRQHHNNQGIARSSKQWINPNKNIPPESPNIQRSQSFVSHQGQAPLSYRPQSSHSDQHPEAERRDSQTDQHGNLERPRPRSSDGHPERHAPPPDHQQRRFAGAVRYYEGPTGPNAVPLPRRDAKHTPTGRASVDRDAKVSSATDDSKDNELDEKQVIPQAERRHDVQPLLEPVRGGDKRGQAKTGAERRAKVARPRFKKSHIRVPAAMVTYNPKSADLSISGEDDLSDSEDEDMEQYFDHEIAKNQADVDKFTRVDDFDTEIPLRYAAQTCQASVHFALMEEGIRGVDRYHGSALLNGDAVNEAITEKASIAAGADAASSEQDFLDGRSADASGPVSSTSITIESPAPYRLAPKQTEQTNVDMAAASSVVETEVQPPTAEPTVPETDAMDIDKPEEIPISEPQPKREEVENETLALQPSVSEPVVAAAEQEDADMLDAPGEIDDMPPSHMERRSVPAKNGNALPISDVARPLLHVAEEDQLASRRTSGRTTPDQADADAEGEDDDDATEIEEIDFTRLGDFRRYMPTPPLDDLPDFAVQPWYRNKKVHKAYEMPEGLGDAILGQINDEHLVKTRAQADQREDYRAKYDEYLRFTMSNDPVAVKNRHYLSGGATTTGSGKATANAEERKEGGRRAPSRFATELDLNLAIQQSIQEENERREREERARQEKYRSEKEAVIPDMYWSEEDRKTEFYLDRSGYLPVEKLVDAWQVLPPINNFSEEEADLFEKAFLEFPKQWGKIAEQIPNRDFRACIQYYYSSKKEQNYKAKLKKQPKKRKAKGRKQKATSELGNAENETETQEETVGENGERRRPRRAAAPTWGYEQTPAVDSDGNTPAATPGRGRKNNSGNDNGTDKPEAKTRRRRAPAKDKGEKAAAKASALALAQAQAQAQAQVQTQGQGQVQQVLAPSPAPGTKGNRSRSSSRANNPGEWSQSQLGPNDLGRLPAHLEVPTAGMQPSMPPPVQQPTLASPERMPMPLTNSTMSEVMAPPSLRPEPPPPPANVPTFDSFAVIQSGPDRTRTPAQASSYWSVSETTDFPSLLRSFGTDWQAIANYMKTKTTVMVKNYYLRSKDAGKPEWERIAVEADEQLKRGEKRPPPPPLTPAPTRGKRFDPSSAGNTPLTVHRTLAAAEPMPEDYMGQAKMESPGPAPSLGVQSARFQVPIAQAPVNQTPPPLGPGQSRSMTPQHQQMHGQQQQQPSQHPREQHVMGPTMSPGGHALRPPVASFAYPERDEPAMPLSQLQPQPPVQQQPGQSARVSHMTGPGQVPVSAGPAVSSPGLGPVSQPPVTEAMSSRAPWATEAQNPHLSQLSQMGQFPTQPREGRDRPARILESQLREAPRHAERAPVRLKQEPELVSPYDSPFAPIHQQSQRVVPARPDPAQQMVRQQHQHQDPHRNVAPGPPAGQQQQLQQQQQPPLYANAPSQQPPMRNIHGEPGHNLPPQPQPGERSTLGVKPPPMGTRQDPYGAATIPGSQQAPPGPAPNQSSAARPPQEPRKTSNLFALLNDDPPAPPPPKRVTDVSSGLKPSSTPPPQSMSARPPPPPSAASTSLRREPEPAGYSSYRNPGGPTSVMPSLKPYNIPSPQEHHSSLQRPTMGTQSNTPAAGPERGEYYSRHAYTQSQQQQQQVETSPQGPHYLNPSQHAQQQPSMGYQSQPPYPPYGSAGSQQPHSTSPAPPFSAHQTPGGPRREPGREPPSQWTHQSQQQQDRSMQQPQPTPWPSNAPQLKANQSPSPWGAAHGNSHGNLSIKASQQPSGQFPSQSSGWRESTQPPQPQQQQHHPLGLRDDPRGQPVYDSPNQRPPSGMIQHGHHSSLSGRYPAGSQDLRRQQEPGPSPQGQPGYGRYPSSQPQPAQRDAHGLPPRSYTPVSMYDPRGPPPPSGPAVQAMHERHAIREMQFRELQREREVLEQQQQQQQQQPPQGRMHSSGLRGGPGPNDGEAYHSRGQDRTL